MKKLLLVLSALLSIAALMAFSGAGSSDAHTSTGGAPNGHAGDPGAGGKTCSTPGCHTGATVGTITGVFTSTIPSDGYTAGATYTITASFVRPGHNKFGFQATPQNLTGTKLGTLANITAGTQIPGGIGSGKYITHTNSSVSGTNSRTWNFRWTAPATGLGPVTFYGTFNATNNNGSTSGDSIFKSTLFVNEAPASVYDFQTGNFSLSTFPNPVYDNLNVKFVLSESSSVRITLFDIKGKQAGTLLSEAAMNGEVSESFDISSYPQGIYFLLLDTDGKSALHKFVKL